MSTSGLASPSRRKLWILAASIAATACLSPTLPLPPPGEPKQSELDEATGTLHLTGAVQPQAWVYAINQRTQKGYIQITGADGRYDLTVAAQHGDPMGMWYEISGEASYPLYFDIE